MRSNTKAWHQAFWTAGTAALLLAAGLAHAQQPARGKQAPAAAPVTETQAQASAILTRMADFLGGAQRFSVSMRAGYDAVQKSGQKIEFGDTRKVTLSRPDRLRMEGERSDGVKTLTVFNGKDIVLIDETSNVYATAPQPGGLDDTIVPTAGGIEGARTVGRLCGEDEHPWFPLASSRRAHRHGGFPGLGRRWR